MLTSKQKRFLKSKANRLRPILHVGKNGLNDALVSDLVHTLETHELLKINILQNSDATAPELGEALTEAIPNLTVVQSLGRVLTLYRPASKIKNRKLSEEVKAIQ
ncbi:ribosome assembly RNA-binding protein YhbY [Lapidilactobacillus bayanensis]|uniref:ribosome assembly RNA-binding protein YhbY n=1 Tax=Lapidilactobacillus bayanensis TaxID=2485998 RepID=UPI000F793B43|nr:ribosome assembly RNA-binding protein YhbY [Lapidilactobacillus bayanensis]